MMPREMRTKRKPDRVRLGIDLGSTRTAVARVESGNYPLVSFEGEWGEGREWYPSLIAIQGSRRVYGWEAWSKQPDENWHKIRSLKSCLSHVQAETCLEIGGQKVSVLTLLVEYLAALHRDLIGNSNLEANSKSILEVMIGVPANANSIQRLWTLEGFRRAGFQVLGLIDEPSAVAIEYAFRYRRKADQRREYLLVYDLGGGTFDLSVMQMTGLSHRVMTTAGIERLGGDDFDRILAGLALSRAGAGLEHFSNFWVLEECREKKESLNLHTKRIHIDLSRALGQDLEVILPVADFYALCIPTVEQTINAVEGLLQDPSPGGAPAGWSQRAGLYLVGGAAELPIVYRMLRGRYGNRLRKSPYPCAASAIGLAIAAGEMEGYFLEDRFPRHSSVWAQADRRQQRSFYPIFAKDATEFPGGEPMKEYGQGIESPGAMAKLINELMEMGKQFMELKASEARCQNETALLRAEESKHRTIIENFPQRIFVKDKDLAYLFSNEKYARSLKRKPDEIVGRTDYDFFPEEVAEKSATCDKEIMERGITEEMEEKWCHDGRESVVQMIKAPFRDEKGEVVGILGILWDITEKKHAEEELRKSHSRLEQLLFDRTAELHTAQEQIQKVTVARKVAEESLERSEDTVKRLVQENETLQKRLEEILRSSIDSLRSLIKSMEKCLPLS